MATRLDTQRRREELRQTLLANCQSGTLVAGQPLPPLRVLAVQFNLSVPTVSQVVKELMDEGFLHTRSTAGTFVGPHRDMANSLFLVLSPYLALYNTQYAAACRGFEERVAQLSGNCLNLDWDTAREWQRQGRLPEVRGAFELGPPREGPPISMGPGVGRAVFNDQGEVVENGDAIRFDNFDGGRQAALHLLKAGHQNIAFLGLHGRARDSGQFNWSEQREDGWKSALEERGIEAEWLSFLPLRTGNAGHEDQIQNTLTPAREIVARPEITAVVAVNPLAMTALTAALEEAGIPPERWPATVAFDDEVTSNNLTVSVVRLSWERLGREAADMLWHRGLNLGEPPVRRLVPMLLIPRLSCRSIWSLPVTNRPLPSGLLERAEPARAA